MKLFSLAKPAARATALTGLSVRWSRSRARCWRASSFRACSEAPSSRSLAVQGAGRDVQRGGQRLRAVGQLRCVGQRLPHALYQQAVAAVLAHGEGQGALQHQPQRVLVALQGQVEVAGVESQQGLGAPKRGATPNSSG